VRRFYDGFTIVDLGFRGAMGRGRHCAKSGGALVSLLNMKPAPFEYHAPRTIAETICLLAELENAKILAGGQSLVPMMNFRYVAVDHLIDIAKVDGLSGIDVSNGKMRVGAMTRQHELEFSQDVAKYSPLLIEALRYVGHRQTRNWGTIGGSLAHADPAAEQPTVCAAYDAVVEIVSKHGSRRLPFKEFAVGFMTTAVRPEELVVAIEFPLWPPGHGFSFQEFARRHGDFAIAGAASLVEVGPDRTVRRASVALCGVADTPIRVGDAEDMLVGKELNTTTARAAAQATNSVEALSDVHASANYRRHLAKVLTFRSLRAAAARCGLPF
jgi:aerobic carbon-monoxide dehydrogenase medium subunit